MGSFGESIKGRGVNGNPGNRFERARMEVDPELVVMEGLVDEVEANQEGVRRVALMQFLRDRSCSIVSRNESPDVPFEVSVNAYRGCEHGCVYCYARPTHEYLGMSAGLDFETKILVKMDAPELLRKALMDKKWVPQSVMMSGVTDCYQPVERKLGLTRKCLQVLAEFGNPVSIVTKNALVTRDLDILGEMAKRNLARVSVSVTSLDAKLTAILEPRTSTPRARLEAIGKLSAAGVPVNVLVAPVVPAITDVELSAILKAGREAGATGAGYTMMRLPYGVKDLFVEWLRVHFPDRAEKVLHRIESLRGGKMNDARFGTRLRGEGIWAEQVAAVFKMECGRLGFLEERRPLEKGVFKRPAVAGEQGSLFG